MPTFAHTDCGMDDNNLTILQDGDNHCAILYVAQSDTVTPTWAATLHSTQSHRGVARHSPMVLPPPLHPRHWQAGPHNIPRRHL